MRSVSMKQDNILFNHSQAVLGQVDQDSTSEWPSQKCGCCFQYSRLLSQEKNKTKQKTEARENKRKKKAMTFECILEEEFKNKSTGWLPSTKISESQMDSKYLKYRKRSSWISHS